MSAGNRPELAPKSPSKFGRVGPYSRTLQNGALGKVLDGRSRWGRFVRAYERMLRQHLGGDPSAIQSVLITRAVRLALHVEMMDERSLMKSMTDIDTRNYLAWANTLRRTLVALGIEPGGADASQLSGQLGALAPETEEEVA